MNSNRKRPSRFEDNRSSGNKNTRKDYGYNQNDVFSSRDIGPIGMQMLPNKTPAQLAFDAEFAKWEKSFEDWKRQFANHPDRNSYFEYERKFLEVRDKLLLKRAQIYSVTQNPMDAMLNLADSMANSILSKFDGGPSGMSGMMSVQQNLISMAGRSGPVPLMSLPGPSSGGRWGSGDDRGGNSWGRDDRRSGRDDRKGNSRFDDRRGGRDDRSRSAGKGRDDRRDNDRRGGRGNDRDRGQNRGQNNNRDRGRGGPTGGRNDRNQGRKDNMKEISKPSQREIERQLAKKDVYPLNKWVYCGTAERPALVGKRAKKKNAKILRVIERKRRIAAGELDPDKEAEENAQNQNERPPKNELPLRDRINILFEQARQTEFPKVLAGNGKRRLKNIKAKPQKTWTEDERNFVALANFIQEKRSIYLSKNKEGEKNETKEAKESEVNEPTEAKESEANESKEAKGEANEPTEAKGEANEQTEAKESEANESKEAKDEANEPTEAKESEANEPTEANESEANEQTEAKESEAIESKEAKGEANEPTEANESEANDPAVATEEPMAN